MAEELETELPDVREDGRRPPRAVVVSHRVEEEMFGMHQRAQAMGDDDSYAVCGVAAHGAADALFGGGIDR
ncbi:hypothetical protein ACC699_38070, partial [Rhizobium ruizarguesonis]